jgi:predicted phosphoribosyltransferase
MACGDRRILATRSRAMLQATPDMLGVPAAREQEELERRQRAYRRDLSRPDPRGKTVFLVDDGLATGSTMRAAVAALRREGAGRVVVAVPIAAPETCADLRGEADAVVCARTPEPFVAVGRWYEHFAQTSDEEVRDLLEQARQRERPAA